MMWKHVASYYYNHHVRADCVSLSVHGLFSQPCAGMFVLSRPAVSTPTHLKATPDEAQPTDRRTDRIAPIGQVTK